MEKTTSVNRTIHIAQGNLGLTCPGTSHVGFLLYNPHSNASEVAVISAPFYKLGNGHREVSELAQGHS